MHDAIIIGAGVSGLSCAHHLSRAGTAVLVLEKSRSLGGRCATRLWRGHLIDHGAQYITATTPEFADVLQKHGGWRTIPNDLFHTTPPRDADNKARLYHPAGNRALGEFLATGITVLRETTVEKIEKCSEGYTVAGHTARCVVITTPLPQAENILGLPLGIYEYQPCLTAFCAYPGAFAGRTSECYAKLFAGHDCEWSACENHKAGRVNTGETVMVYQASPAFSRTHLEEPPDVWLPLLRKTIEPLWELDNTPPLEFWTHRWRYARVSKPLAQEPTLSPGLFLAGDGLCESRVESAWLSGRDCAKKALQYLAC
jgi:renalase